MAEGAMKPAPAGKRSWLIVRRILGLLAGAVFVYAGVLKVREPLEFANDISNYHLLPWTVGVRLAFYLPWLEILAGLALILHRLFSGALAITGALMFGFIAATIWAKGAGDQCRLRLFRGREQRSHLHFASRAQ